MNFIRAHHNNIQALRWVALVAAVAVVVFFIGSGTIQASNEWSVPVPYGESTPDPQQASDDESGLPWLFAVFFVAWAAFFGYVFVMSRRQREMRREIEALKRALAERESKLNRVGQG